MMILKKLALLISLALGMCVPNVVADAVTDKAIYTEVHKAFHNKTVTATTLKTILKALMSTIAKLIAHKVDGEYKELHEAIKALNLDEPRLLVLRLQLKKVIEHLPKEAKEYIKKRFPALG